LDKEKKIGLDETQVPELYFLQQRKAVEQLVADLGYFKTSRFSVGDSSPIVANRNVRHHRHVADSSLCSIYGAKDSW
jgi:hypothetical protein